MVLLLLVMEEFLGEIRLQDQEEEELLSKLLNKLVSQRVLQSLLRTPPLEE
jgi:hypothetical protein